jgi:hypothetical protein
MFRRCVVSLSSRAERPLRTVSASVRSSQPKLTTTTTVFARLAADEQMGHPDLYPPCAQ